METNERLNSFPTSHVQSGRPRHQSSGFAPRWTASQFLNATIRDKRQCVPLRKAVKKVGVGGDGGLLPDWAR